MGKRVRHAVFAFFTGTAIGCVLSMAYYLAKWRLRAARNRRRYRKSVNSGNTCAACGGTNTQLAPGNGPRVCADTKLCVQTVNFQHTLATLEDTE